MDLKTLARTHWDRIGAWVLVAIGLLALGLGYRGVSGTAYLVEQLPYVVSGGLLAIFLLGVGAMLWLSADLRDEWRKLDDIERRLAEIAENTERVDHADAPPVTPATNGHAAPSGRNGRLVAAPGRARPRS